MPSQSHCVNVVTEPWFPHPQASIVLTPSSCVLTGYESPKSWMVIPITKTHETDKLFSWAKRLCLYPSLLKTHLLSRLFCVCPQITAHYLLYDTVLTLYVGTNQLGLVSLPRTISLSLQASCGCPFVIIVAKAPPIILQCPPPLNPYRQHILLKGLMGWCFDILQDFLFSWINITNTMHCVSAFYIKKHS